MIFRTSLFQQGLLPPALMMVLGNAITRLNNYATCTYVADVIATAKVVATGLRNFHDSQWRLLIAPCEPWSSSDYAPGWHTFLPA
jgi:hypothetical protein